jgi:hypothetical protein
MGLRQRSGPRTAAFPIVVAMEFSRDLRPHVIAGDVSVSFRLWTRPKVRVGGLYPVGPATIEVDSVELVPFRSVTAEDVQRAGEPSMETLRQRAAHSGPITDDTLVYRIEFHLVWPPTDAKGPRGRSVKPYPGRR